MLTGINGEAKVKLPCV